MSGENGGEHITQDHKNALREFSKAKEIVGNQQGEKAKVIEQVRSNLQELKDMLGTEPSTYNAVKSNLEKSEESDKSNLINALDTVNNSYIIEDLVQVKEEEATLSPTLVAVPDQGDEANNGGENEELEAETPTADASKSFDIEDDGSIADVFNLSTSEATEQGISVEKRERINRVLAIFQKKFDQALDKNLEGLNLDEDQKHNLSLAIISTSFTPNMWKEMSMWMGGILSAIGNWLSGDNFEKFLVRMEESSEGDPLLETTKTVPYIKAMRENSVLFGRLISKLKSAGRNDLAERLLDSPELLVKVSKKGFLAPKAKSSKVEPNKAKTALKNVVKEAKNPNQELIVEDFDLDTAGLEKFIGEYDQDESAKSTPEQFQASLDKLLSEHALGATDPSFINAKMMAITEKLQNSGMIESILAKPDSFWAMLVSLFMFGTINVNEGLAKYSKQKINRFFAKKMGIMDQDIGGKTQLAETLEQVTAGISLTRFKQSDYEKLYAIMTNPSVAQSAQNDVNNFKRWNQLSEEQKKVTPPPVKPEQLAFISHEGVEQMIGALTTPAGLPSKLTFLNPNSQEKGDQYGLRTFQSAFADQQTAYYKTIQPGDMIAKTPTNLPQAEKPKEPVVSVVPAEKPATPNKPA